MGNRYCLFCLECKEYFDLGSEIVWFSDVEKMYCLKDFLLSHTGHHLECGGDEWNCARDYDSGEQLPLKDYKEYDSECSKQDFANEVLSE